MRILVALLVAACGLGLAACRAAPRAGSDPLRVASDLANPPFAAVADDADDGGSDRPIGRDVEMMERLGRELGRPIEWVRMPFSELLDAVEAGEVDVVCATIGVTPERARRVAFTRPYFETAIAVVCRAGPGEPRTLDELAGLRVGAAASTTSERAVRRRLPRAVGVFENKDELSTDERLASGALDAAAMDGPAADALVAESAGRFVRLTESLGAERYALAVSRGREALVAELDSALDALERSGWMLALDERFGVEASR